MYRKYASCGIVEEESFKEIIDDLRRTFERINDVYEGISFVLSHQPTIGEACCDEPDHYVFKTTEIGNTPSFWVLYRYEEGENEKKVYLISITPAETDEE